MTRTLLFRPEAMIDIKNIFLWYEKRRKGLGEYFLLCLDLTLSGVVDNPFRFPKIQEPVRRALVKRFPFSVFFAPAEKTIMVLAVFHQRRSEKEWKKRLRKEFLD